ncbi:hypothetical protein K443DRAFT_469407 [Laccaria amethystina LaAM-08-1]|uniref:DUF6699 domain-containing protein n=1 Tax=Laccaria amethystina LaAM-08-1 TaxID=1095629 RepID=A0A0C9WVP6_9AGAR|nr:hypothetical protein K443DRAFT_469407 [Laccaria amethystina LaAM-08-1]
MRMSTPGSGTDARAERMRVSGSYHDEFQQNSRSFHPYSSLQRATPSSPSSSTAPNPWVSQSSVPQPNAFRPPSHTHRLAFGRPRCTSHTPVPTESLIVPPPLPRPHSIPLPPLSAVEVGVNPILVTGIAYNIRAPTSFADCPSRRHSSRARDAWRYEAAVRPPVASMTIFLDFDLHRPIVVFPTNRYDAVVAVSDVLDAVNRRVGVVAGELGEACDAGYAVQRLRREVWWVGLVPSLRERDVWVLRTV